MDCLRDLNTMGQKIVTLDYNITQALVYLTELCLVPDVIYRSFAVVCSSSMTHARYIANILHTYYKLYIKASEMDYKSIFIDCIFVFLVQ